MGIWNVLRNIKNIVTLITYRQDGRVGLRRQFQVLVRKGMGSNPILDKFFFSLSTFSYFLNTTFVDLSSILRSEISIDNLIQSPVLVARELDDHRVTWHGCYTCIEFLANDSPRPGWATAKSCGQRARCGAVPVPALTRHAEHG